MIRTHSLLVILPIFFSAFSLIHFMSTFFSRQRHLYRGHRILFPVHHLEWTDNKPFSGFIGSRHITKREAVCPSKLGGEILPSHSIILLNYLNTIQYIWSSFSWDHQNNNNNDSLLLLFDGLWKVKADYMVQEDKHNNFYSSQ